MTCKLSRNLILPIVSVLIAAMSLGIGIALQGESLAMVAVYLVLGAVWLLWMSLKGINLPRLLIPLSLIYILPMEYTFHFALVMLCLVLIADLYHQNMREFVVSYPFSFLILTLFGLIALSKTYVDGGILYFISTIVVPLVCFLVITNTRKDKPALDTWMRVISLVAVLVGLYGIYIALVNPGKRIGSTWSNAMTINGFYALSFFFCLALAFKAKLTRFRLLWIFAAIIIFLGMLFTYTRMAMLAIVFGLGLLILKYRRIRFWGLLAICLIPLLIPSSMMNRGAAVAMIDISILIRFIAWYHAAFIIAENLLTGIGFSTWKDIYYDVIPMPIFYAQHAHNVYINLLLEIGLFGTLAYLAIIFKSLVGYYRKAISPQGDMVAFCVWTGMLALLFSCLTDIFIQQYMISLLFWITLALMVKESGLAKLDIPQE